MALEYIRALTLIELEAELPPLLPSVDRFLNDEDVKRAFLTLREGTIEATEEFSPSTTSTLVLYKHTPAKLTTKSQIGFLSIPASEDEDSPLFTTLQELHRNCFVPAISSSLNSISSSSSTTDNLSSFTSTMRDLHTLLDHLKRSANVPTVNLSPHPEILSLLSSSAPSLDPSSPSDTPLDVNIFDASTLLSSDETLTSIQSTVNVWIKDITKLTSLTTTTPFPNDANEEISFWKALFSSLTLTSNTLNTSPSTQLTISVLKQAKRFVTTTALENNTHLPTALAYTSDVNSFLQNFPINALLSSTNLPSLTKSTTDMFSHYPKVRNSKNYDLYRLAKLLESTTESLKNQIVAILKSQNVMKTPFDTFQSLDSDLTALFSTWDAEYKKFTTFFLEQYKRRGRLSTSVSAPSTTPLQLLKSLDLSHVPLQARWQDISSFRRDHNNLLSVVKSVLSSSSSSDTPAILQSLTVASNEMANAPIFDLSPSGIESFSQTLSSYESSIDEIENNLSSLLHSKLSSATSAEEMFKHFSKFNPLFVRPRIRSAIKHYQTELIKNVSNSVALIQKKFLLKYEQSPAANFAEMRDIPPVAGKIMWAKLMENQLNLIMEKMESVLGQGWEQQAEGRQLKKTCSELMSKLDTEQFFKAWRKNWEKELTSSRNNERLSSYLISIQNHPKSSSTLIPTCNYETNQTNLFKEVRNLKYLQFDIPPMIQKMADDAASKYPHAMRLNAALRSYVHVRTLIDGELNLTMLVQPQLSTIQASTMECFNSTTTGVRAKSRMKWDSKTLKSWVAAFSEEVFTLQEKVELLLQTIDTVNSLIASLPGTPFSFDPLSTVLSALQAQIDQLSLSGFSNLSIWVESLNFRIKEILTERLTTALTEWTASVSSPDPASSDSSVPPVKVEIIIQDQTILSSPSLPAIRQHYLANFYHFTSTVTSLPLLSSSRFDVLSSSNVASQSATFSSIIPALHKSSPVLLDAYTTINSHLKETTVYISTWLSYQSLWDMSMESITNLLGDDIKKWQQLLIEARTARSTLDNSDDSSTHSIGPVTIFYAKVQNKINLKFDAWQKSLQTTFGTILLNSIKTYSDKFTTAKQTLESIFLEGATTTIIDGVTFIQQMKQSSKMWAKEATLLESSEALLKKQRFAFPPTWTHATIPCSAFTDFETILARRTKQMDDQIPTLQQRVRLEDKQMSKRITDLIANWEKQKPLSGNTPPATASEALASFQIIFKKSIHEFDQLSSAKLALSLPASSINPLTTAHEDLNELSEVWTTIRPTHDNLEEINDTPWASLVPRKIRASLNSLLDGLRSLPSKVRQYDVFTQVNETIKSYVANVSLLTDLKTEALKPRHWKLILKRLNLQIKINNLNLGHLFEAGILSKKKDIAEILSIAQGEMALEIFLRQVREYWQTTQIELVLYQNRVRLIKSWDIIFAKLEEHMSSLSQMKQSPYFKSVQEFQEEASSWEERLTKLQQIFDLWIDVQRRWVYLESIFFGSADIKAQLPSEYARFKSVDTEFTQLMKKIAQKPNPMEALQIENLYKQLERQEALMTKIQKALGEYLANQRQSFSRFYFVGDEDLLEMIGNSNEPMKVMAHLGKMFASISNMRWLDPKNTKKPNLLTLTHMTSKDGEAVPLSSNIDVVDKVPVKAWLASIETNMKESLASLLSSATASQPPITSSLTSSDQKQDFVKWASSYPAQIMILASLIQWSMGIDSILSGTAKEVTLRGYQSTLDSKLGLMATTVLSKLDPQTRKKYEQLITELVHQRDVTRELVTSEVSASDSFKWLYHLRFNYDPTNPDLLQKLNIKIANASFFYGFEYLGIGERLVQTPLTDRCYLTLTQALHFRMGGNPFGPAGTGKTESVKALGAQLGRFVLVFNCDEAFDFASMGRLFAGLCQVGAWGCFDEFNRLEERILSAVSQQILTIQRGLIARSKSIELLGRPVNLHDSVGIFVTMNPGYAGRSNLPDNLKNLFRAVAMVIPDRKLIAQVMLFSQGVVSAEVLSGKVVLLFQLCEEQLSPQSHYDFGLRALKTLLVSAGGLKRKAIEEDGEPEDMVEVEKNVLIKGACNNVVPKLVAEDLSLFGSLLKAVFPGADVQNLDGVTLTAALKNVCARNKLVMGQNWVEKILQLHEVLSFRHGVMLVGPTGSGKSTSWKCLIEAMEIVEGTKCESYVIDPKAIDKEQLYGSLDPTTMEWKDGVLTATLRTIIANLRGEASKRHWIVFDGDVDPEWAENLNSVLDDNKLLTLPNGERLSLGDNVRILLEVDSLEEATPATVSRCGMLYFSDEIVSTDMQLKHMLLKLGDNSGMGEVTVEEEKKQGDDVSTAQIGFLFAIRRFFVGDGQSPVAADLLEEAMKLDHIMMGTRMRLLNTLEALLRQGIEAVIKYDDDHPDFPMAGDHLAKFATNFLAHSLQWSFASSCSWADRTSFSDILVRACGVTLPDGEHIFDHRVRIEDGLWEAWRESVPKVEIEGHRVTNTDLVIPTTDTLRHVEVLDSWLTARQPLILCGPPGSGKSMTLMSVLNSRSDMLLAPLNFSSGTSVDLILKTLNMHCEYLRTSKGMTLQPSQSGKWLVVMCDEINLPQPDAYGTQTVITFMRQLTEQGGFWRNNTWVTLQRIQFVGAANPETDPGRVRLSERFLRFAPVLMVDFPSRESLVQIYSTLNGGIMKLHPQLRGEVESLTKAQIDLYTDCQDHFTPDVAPQYVYSPRELSRFVRAIYGAVKDLDSLTREELIRLWAHEALRLFYDRLISDDERSWINAKIDEVAEACWGALGDALQRPIMFSSWLSKNYVSVGKEELRAFTAARLKVFYEEILDIPLVLFDDVLEHVLRIDRVLKQPMGHALLVGESGAGKTVLSKFAAWMNGLSIFQIKCHSNYGIEDFNEDLRGVMKRVGVEGEKICFIFDEANALSSGFLEAMNALLASGDVPGLFEGDDLTNLMGQCRDAATRDGIVVDGDDELFARFTKNVQVNLHIVFTMNPSGDDFANRSTTSPALFNRCVVDWFGTWSTTALGQVGKEFTKVMDVGDQAEWHCPRDDSSILVVGDAFRDELAESGPGLRQAVVASLVDVHNITKGACESNNKTALCRTYLSPRDYLDLITNFVKIAKEKRGELEEQQLHINVGLAKLKETEEQVRLLEEGLGAKERELREKEEEANQKLQQMIADQNVAETQKKEAVRMNEEVSKQQGEISKRQAEAEKELSEAEPALINAQESVKSIRKSQLDEIRALARPPDNVRMTLEAVAIMMGRTNLEWSDIRKMIQQKDFIPGILDFDLDKLGERQIEIVKVNYLSGVLTEETVLRSSKACGPLFKWVESQIHYSEIFNNVEPLRAEVEKLQADAEEVILKKDEVEKEVSVLEERIAKLKLDYADLIRNVEVIKSDMEGVKSKVVRANTLIKSLMVESDRWQASSGMFEDQIRSVVGDALLSASFLTYAGFFDHKNRGVLLGAWKNCLESCGVAFRDGFDGVIEYLSKGSERLSWEANGLPKDNLAVENAIILSRFNRFPLVIDPSGQATDFLMEKYKSEKIIKTSFLDGGFMKTLASAIRFGTVLLVQDVENVDPVLNPILNKELMRTGGRTLVRLGAEEIDYSPKFAIILTTRDSAVRLTPDLCSRVTLVNFTITPASLQSQALSMLLRTEKPEMEGKRSALMKVRGEQNVKLRELEDRLLDKISSVQGSILDDNSVIKGMEEIKTEAKSVEDAILEGESVMLEVETSIAVFEPLAAVISDLFFCLEGLMSVNPFYQFSLQFFMCVLAEVLGVKSEGGSRLEELKSLLFNAILGRVGRSLFEEDKLVFALRVAALKGKGFDVEGEGKKLETFVEKGSDFATEMLGQWQGLGLNVFQEVVEKQVVNSTPVLLCSAPGYDVSGRVMHLSEVMEKELTSVAMGSSEGYSTAEKMIGAAAKTGGWVMLKNIHLCPRDWLVELEKKLFSLTSDANFRIFLTAEMTEENAGRILPLTLVRMSDVVVCEAPVGLKKNLLRFFGSIDEERFVKVPLERGRLYLLVAWIYGIVQERLRYEPTGWSKKYEFSEADALNALDVVDSWVDLISGGKKAHIAPDKLPWEALRTVLSVSVFGGRIDNEFDQEVLDSFIDKVLVSQAYDMDFSLVESIVAPEGGKRVDMMQWVEALPEVNSPTWLGLSGAAEMVRLRARGGRVLEKLLSLGGGKGPGEDGRARMSSVVERMETVARVVNGWLAKVEGLEKSLQGGKEWAKGDESMDSLMRCIAREVKLGIECVRSVVSDMKEIITYCEGSAKLTNQLKTLIDAIAAGITPKDWIGLYTGGEVVADQWIDDFVKRLEQVNEFIMSGGKDLEGMSFWVGGLLNPGSFVTATRQFVARKGDHSIDELELVLHNKGEGVGFKVSGMMIEGGKLVGGGIEKSEELIEEIGDCCLEWRTIKGGEEENLSLPVYLDNSNRKQIIVRIKVEGASGNRSEWLQRGLALFFNSR